ncbi:MAG: hypothetical protein Kow0074_10670 [Candidatus Zixiibacteriota bacterium]
MKSSRWLLAAALTAVVSLAVIGCSDDDSPTGGGDVPLEFVGSAKCGECHAEKYSDWKESGHPYKLTKIENGQAPQYPHSAVPNPPDGYTWNDISYVIGGYGWKARFMRSDGYIITGDGVQYNLGRADIGAPEAQWVGYETSLDKKPYTCGTCHTTGWESLDENGGVHQDGLEGIHGTWYETGITCEACHGMGSQHANRPSKTNINIDRNASACGNCHFRDTNHGILASGGFIKHHEQFDEMISAGHVALNCVDCHDPHKGTRYELGGLIADCEDCHAGEAANMKHNGAPDCKDCHMGRASKSARFVNAYRGDIQTHIMKINTDPVGKDAMFYEEGGSTFSHGFITLDFACYGCHKDESGVGGSYSQKTLAELSTFAKGMHD